MAQSQDVIRATVQSPRCKSFPARADVVFYRGAIVCKRIDSELAEIPDSANPRSDLIPLGIARYQLDMTGEADGAQNVVVEAGNKRDFKTGTGDDEITVDHVGQTWYMYDDETAYLTNLGGTLSPGGTVVFVDTDDYSAESNITLHFDFELVQVLSAAASLGQSLALTAPTELTIATGAVTVTQSVHTIDTESDASSDNLDTISGSVANQLYLIKPASAARTVVIRDAATSSGNIYTPHARAISLAESTDWALLISDGTNLTVLAAPVKATDNVPYMQAVDATLASGTITINSAITVAANSEVIAYPKGTVTGSTNFAMVRELVASRVAGAPGVGTLVIEAITNTGVLDSDAAGAIRVVILTPQT